MTKSLFIIGAGASRSAGGPLMFDFMNRAAQIYYGHRAGWAEPQFHRVLQARQKLQSALAKSHVEIDNIEDLFGSFEMARFTQRLADLSFEEIVALPQSLRFVIMRTVEQTIDFQFNEKDPIVQSPYPYGAFAELLLRMCVSNEFAPVTVICFNYDLALDYALAVRGIPIDYALNRPTTATHRILMRAGRNVVKHSTNGSITVLKPHGSLNWTRDPHKATVLPQPVVPLNAWPYRKRFGINESFCRPIDTMELMHGPDEWGERPVPEPILVPPTWSKMIYQEMLANVWIATSAALASAENIFVMGYSLPPSDQFFRSFFALSTISDAIVERFWVYDPGDVKDRFSRLLGPAITGRDRFQHERLPFTSAIPTLARSLRLYDAIIDRLLLNKA